MGSNHEQQRPYRNNRTQFGKQKHAAQPETHQKSDNKAPRTEHNISVQASLAIAANLAYSQLVKLLGCHRTDEVPEILKNLDTECSALLALITYQRQCAENDQPAETAQIEDLNKQLPQFNRLRPGLDKLWARVMRPLSIARRPYYSAEERHLLMFELMRLCENIRNLYSHWIPVNDNKKRVFDLTGKPMFSAFLELLFAQAHSRLSLPNWFSLVDIITDPQDASKKQFSLNPGYGATFIFSLFNTRSQMQRLLQGIQLRIPTKQMKRTLKRRENQLYLFYARRDGYSETQLDPHSALLREIVSYLNLPPLESATGQQVWNDWKIKLKARNPQTDESITTDTPQFRRSSKHVHYALQTLDTLNLLPEWAFAGHTQHTSPDSDEEDSTLWESAANPDNDIPSKHGHAQRSKLGITAQYGRNVQQNKEQRFVYDLRDTNLRFQLTLEGKTLSGVMRERDFCNLVYVVLTNPSDVKKITGYAHQWLQEYQTSLQQTDLQILGDIVQAYDGLQAKHYPRQIQWKLRDKTPDLLTRLKGNLQGRLERLRTLNQRCVLPKRDLTGRNAERSKDDLPRHEKIHELLHIFIRHLNAEGRSKVTLREYSHLQQLLLNYKGTDNRNEIERIKGERPDTEHSHDGGYTDKAKFWLHLHHTYTPELVNATDSNGDKIHPIWAHCMVEGKVKDMHGNERTVKNIPGLDKLFKLVLEDEIKTLQALQKHLTSATCNDTELAQIAFGLQVSLMDTRSTNTSNTATSATDSDNKPRHGEAKARHDALHYSVLPASFCQQALGMECREETALNKQGRQNRYPSMAERIRSHAGERQLKDEYYDPAKRMPEAHQKLQQHGKLACLAPSEKKQWKYCVQALNDWHTQDKLCLLMAEALAKKAQIHFGTGSIADYYDQPVQIAQRGADHRGQPRELTVQLNHSLQATRQWFAWSATKLERALCWHYPQARVVEPAELQSMIIAYQSRAKLIVEHVLTLEKSVFDRLKANDNDELLKLVAKNGYVRFNTVMSQLNNWDSADRDALINIRNAALHDILPDQKYLNKLYPDTELGNAVLDVKQLGVPQLQKIKETLQASR